MNFTRRPFASRSPPQIFSNSSIGIFFVHAITEFFTITLFIFLIVKLRIIYPASQKRLVLIGLRPRPLSLEIARISFGSLLAYSRFWTMQRYGAFPSCTRLSRRFASRCCDAGFRLRQIRSKPQFSVANMDYRDNLILQHECTDSPCIFLCVVLVRLGMLRAFGDP